MSILIKQSQIIKPAVQISRSAQTYAEEQGWRSTSWFGSHLSGYYRTKFGSFRGKVRPSSLPEFFIYNPPEELQNHSHWICFSYRGGGKYAVHFSIKPKDVDSGIQQIELPQDISGCGARLIAL